ncbi:hypothetical protein Bca4012_073186 [Brassica carinata]
MADTNQKQSKPTPFPRLFTAFSSFKSFTENDAVASPTSILDTKPFTVLKNPFGSDNPKPYEPETRLKLEPKRIGLAIVHSLVQEENQEPGFSRPRSGTIIFGSQLRIRVPDPPRSSSDFGIKTKNPPVSPSPEEMKKTVSGSGLASPRIFTGYFSTSEMELLEDYTCVTCHGPNPRTIHIFDNCIIESQPGVVLFRSSDPVFKTGPTGQTSTTVRGGLGQKREKLVLRAATKLLIIPATKYINNSIAQLVKHNFSVEEVRSST